MPRLEDLPVGTRFTDVLEAVQAAWLAGDFLLARDLIQRYIDPSGEFCCMRCTSCVDEPWKVNGRLGIFYVCETCTKIITRPGEALGDGGEVFMQGPVQRVVQNHHGIGMIKTTMTATKIFAGPIAVVIHPKPHS